MKPGAACVPGHRLTLLTNGVEYFPALEAALDAATTEVFLETYIFADDATGRRIAAALTRAARRGVAVHVLIDGFGSHAYHWPELLDLLEKGGVRAFIFRPKISPLTLRRSRLRRLHRKLAVIDGRVGFVGGINVIDDMDTPRQTPPRYDYAVRVEGPLLADMHAEVVRLWQMVLWTQFGRRTAYEPAAAPVTAAAGAQRAAFVVRDSFRHRSDIEDAYLAAIAGAQREIVIACAYFFPGRHFRRALREAAKRGVRVVLLLQGRIEYLIMHYASRALYGSFLRWGIEIHEYHKSFLHAKVAVIDGAWATVGSSNIDPFSLLLAREANIVVDDAGFAGELHASLDIALQAGATRLERRDWRRQSWVTRVLMWLFYGLARVMTGMSGYARTNEFE
ncbi:MAG: cardiolipin synthase ClsB [Burkholderiales bacterium]